MFHHLEASAAAHAMSWQRCRALRRVAAPAPQVLKPFKTMLGVGLILTGWPKRGQ